MTENPLSQQEEHRPKVLIIGPLPSAAASDTEVVGGAKVSFEETVRQLRMRHLELDIVSSSRPRQNLPPLECPGLQPARVCTSCLGSSDEDSAFPTYFPQCGSLFGMGRGLFYLADL